MLALLEKRKVVVIDMLLKQLKERLFVVVPPEAVLGMAHVKAGEMQFAKQPQAGVAAAPGVPKIAGGR